MHSPHRSGRFHAGLTALVLTLTAATGLAGAAPAGAASPRDVIVVGNSVSGTVSFLDGHTYAGLGSINVTADAQQVIDAMDPVSRVGYDLTKSTLGGIRYVDDAYLSHDGRTLYVSRGELQDAAAYDLATGRQLWRTKIDGWMADHAALSPDGTELVVSATTANKAEVLSTADGSVRTSFPTGSYAHANDYSADGRYLYNSSIGMTSLPYALNGLKGPKLLTVVDPKTFQVTRTYSFDYGVRPAAFTSDNRYAYLQLSYLNGFAEFDLTTGKVTRTIDLPYSTAGAAMSRDSYPQNSAHHGMALNGDESKLCDLGTIDDYTAIVSRPGLTVDGYVTYPTGSVPYWSWTSADGNHCLVSLAHENQVSVVDYRTATEVARIPVGQYPQRIRLGRLDPSVLGALSSSAG